MASERVQRQIDRLLDEAEEAFAKRDWQVVRDNARDVIGLDPANQDALTFFNAAEQALNKPVSPITAFLSNTRMSRNPEAPSCRPLGG